LPGIKESIQITKTRTMKGFKAMAITFVISACSASNDDGTKQTAKSSNETKELYAAIAKMDSTLFDAFNRRDLDKLKNLFSEDLEFYHDLGGVTNYEQNMINFKKTFDGERRVRRELVKGSLEVYPINNYGAVEIGSHRFYGTEKGQKEKLGSEAKFVQLWQKKDSVWKLTRVISYAHDEY
jgi:ketosteroid isomerase-like protein